MGATPHAYISFETDPGHVHFVPLGDGSPNGFILETEQAASLLVDTMAHCNDEEGFKHGGRGRHHPQEELESAYMSAIFQINNTDYEEEWRIEDWKRYLHRVWNGGVRVSAMQKMRPVPAAIVMPVEDANDWRLMMPDRKTGLPVTYKLNKRFLRDIAESIPRPTDKNSVKADVGFYSKEKK